MATGNAEAAGTVERGSGGNPARLQGVAEDGTVPQSERRRPGRSYAAGPPRWLIASAAASTKAAAAFEEGTKAREHGDDYLRTHGPVATVPC